MIPEGELAAVDEGAGDFWIELVVTDFDWGVVLPPPPHFS
jgi:hypothetical protein